MDAHVIIRHDNQPASRFCTKILDGIFDLGRIVNFGGDGPHLELRRGLDERSGKKLAAIWYGIRIAHDGSTGELRHRLFQHLEILPCDARLQDRKPSDVDARSSNARDTTTTNRS